MGNETRGNESSIMGVNYHDTFSGLAPLHVAAKDGDLKKLVEIMDDGADVNIRACGESNGGKTAAMFAASGGHVDVLKAMQRGPSLLDLPSADGGTAAMSAAAHGYADVLAYIIEKKCNLNAQDEDGWTALMYAVAAGASKTSKGSSRRARTRRLRTTTV